MEVDYTDDGKSDLFFWIKTGNKSIQKKINQLLLSIAATPYTKYELRNTKYEKLHTSY